MEATPKSGKPGHQHLSDPGKEARAASGIPVVPVFDGYRALAILGVVVLHLVSISGVITDDTLLDRFVWGTFGRAVDILFVVSGFVVFLPTVARGGNFGSVAAYAIRRGARLLPAYWVIISIPLLLLAFGIDSSATSPTPTSFLSNYAGLHVPVSLFTGDTGGGFNLNVPMWTVSLEISFYIVLPFIAARYFRHPYAGLAIATAITVIWHFAFDHIFDIASFLDLAPSFNEGVRVALSSKLQLPAIAISFALGMTGAWVYVRYLDRERTPEFRRTLLMVFAVAVLAFALLVYPVGGHFKETREDVWLSIACAIAQATAMIALAMRPGVLQWPFANTPMRKLGDISYGLYLSHLLFLTYVTKIFSFRNQGDLSDFAILSLTVLPASLLYGYLSARFLEQPVRRWARQFGRSAR